MGVAGSLANTVCETSFHLVDTVNIRSKAMSGVNTTMAGQINKIWAREGLYGFCKGFSACFYGGVMTGFLYFALYKQFKHSFHDLLGDKYDSTYIFLLASFTAELLTLSVQYPYDLIKCRLQSVNDKF